MKVLIVEDEAPAFRRLQSLLQDIDASIEIVEVIDSVKEAVKWFRTYNLPDLIFMDIQLADGLSFEIFEEVKISKPIIFTTAYDEYMLKAFKVNSIDYLLKPLNKSNLADSLTKFKELRDSFGGSSQQDLKGVLQTFRDELNQTQYKSRFLVKTADRLVSVPTENIAYCYTENGLVSICTHSDKRYVLDYPLDEIEKQLDPKLFFRLNRQFIANLEAISEIHQYFKGKLLVKLQPNCSEEIIVSREKASVFKKWLDE
ncbi:MAG: DNA-binding LytR/AlgR family response regulator [Flammeovirgaceae bacterium]|jgi:DNA-binding LytR/AlgR family response regulator